MKHLFVSAFFPKHASTALFAIYLFGILLAVIMSKLFRKTMFKEENSLVHVRDKSASELV